MIGPLLTFILGGAQGVPAVPDTWNAATVRLAPARILVLAPDLSQPADAPEEDLEAAPGGPSPEGEAGAPPMPPRLERAEVRPAP